MNLEKRLLDNFKVTCVVFFFKPWIDVKSNYIFLFNENVDLRKKVHSCV